MAASRRVGGAESARKVLRLLLAFDERRPILTASALAAAASLPASTAYRLLALLREQGLVAEAGRGAYRLGGRVLPLARAADLTGGLALRARPVLRRLAAATGASASLLRLIGEVAVSVESAEAPGLPRLTGATGRALALHAGAPGKLLLASLPAGVRADYLARVAAADPGFAPRRRALEAELAVIRRRGWAESEGEVDPGFWAVAAPVVEQGRVAAALFAALPAARADAPHRRRLAEAVIAAAAAVTREAARPGAGPPGAGQGRRRRA
jgi:DNA-binding IclR family transcriptional regulator